MTYVLWDYIQYFLNLQLMVPFNHNRETTINITLKWMWALKFIWNCFVLHFTILWEHAVALELFSTLIFGRILGFQKSKGQKTVKFWPQKLAKNENCKNLLRKCTDFNNLKAEASLGSIWSSSYSKNELAWKNCHFPGK